MTCTALPITSAGRFSPQGIVFPLVPEKQLTSTLIQDAQSVWLLGHLQCLEKRSSLHLYGVKIINDHRKPI